MTDVIPFSLIDDGPAYPAVRYGELWNGFATPVVDEPTLRALLADADRDARTTFPDHSDFASTTWEGKVATLKYDNDLTILTPDSNGHYDLAPLGWTFYKRHDLQAGIR